MTKEACEIETSKAIMEMRNHIAELEKENAELKTKKIPQLERKIASIRGAHSVDCKKLNARLEQVERLKKENAELKKKNLATQDAVTMQMYTNKANKEIADRRLTEAKKVMRNLLYVYQLGKNELATARIMADAEKFLKEELDD